MKNSVFEDMIETTIGNYKLLPSYPFKRKLSYTIFAGGTEKYIDESIYKKLFDLNSKYQNSEFIAKPHFSDISAKKRFLHQSEYDWKSFSNMQDEHMSCEGIYLCGEKFNWLGIYHYDDYLIVGGSEEFINELSILVHGSINWREKFIEAYENGDISMYKSDFDNLIEKLF